MRKLISMIILSSLIFSISAIQIKRIERKDLLMGHWLSQFEKDSNNTYDRNFTPTDPPPSTVRAAAEFNPSTAVIVRYPLGIPYELVVDLSQEIKVITIVSNQSYENQATSNYQSHGANMDNIEFITAPTDSYWTRDFGPWFEYDGNNEIGVVDFPYNRPRPNDDNFPITFANTYNMNLFGMNVEHTGGNYMANGMGMAASTQLVEDENPNLSTDEIDQYFLDFLGVQTYFIVNDPNNTYIDHIDCWGKFLAPDKILIRSVPQSHPQYNEIEEVASYFASQPSPYGTPFRVYRVYTPNNEPYSNSLIINNRVFVPLINSANDQAAIESYQEAMPGYQVIGIVNTDWDIGWLSTDALHCRTHEVADAGLLYIAHMPVSPEISADSARINCSITPFSGANLITDSLYVAYKINNSSYSHLNLISDGENNFHATITSLAPGDTISYYIHASDESGRTENDPYIGAPDPHIFHITGDMVAPIIDFTPVESLTTEDFPYELVADVTDNNSVSQVVLEYTLNGETHNEEFTNTAGTTWTLNWNPVGVQGNDVIEYKIHAFDNANPPNEATSPIEGFYSLTVSAVSNNDVTNIHSHTNLIGLFPNPFNTGSSRKSDSTHIKYYLHNNDTVSLSIYNIKGQIVKSFSNLPQSKGFHNVDWNGTDNSNQPVSSGVYFIRLSTKSISQIKKIMVIK